MLFFYTVKGKDKIVKTFIIIEEVKMSKNISLPVLLLLFFACLCIPATGQDVTYTIPGLYDALPELADGDTVSVIGYYTTPEEQLLFDFYDDYLSTEYPPPFSVIFVLDPPPPDSAWYGGGIIVRGILSRRTDPDPIYPDDTLEILIEPLDYEIMFPSMFPDTGGSKGEAPRKDREEDGKGLLDEECDPCKFAVAIVAKNSGRGRREAFENDIKNFYEYKDSAGYCKENVFVLYDDGTRNPDPANIPDSMVQAATMSNIRAVHDSIAARIARDCGDTTATFQKFVGNHGSPGGAIRLRDGDTLTADSLKEMQQAIIDSCCDEIYDEFNQCYGGSTAVGVSGLDPKGKARIHISSSSGTTGRSWSPTSGDEWLKEKLALLMADSSYEGAVRGAKQNYENYLRRRIRQIEENIDSVRAWLERHPPGTVDSVRREKWVRDTVKWRESVNRRRNAIGKGICKTIIPTIGFCDSVRIYVPPGGQVEIKFEGNSSSCGNVTIYEVNSDGSHREVGSWNWNIPGSIGYTEGNNVRYLNADSSSTGHFIIHNEDSTFTMRVTQCYTQEHPQSRLINYDFVGPSYGFNDGNGEEFGEIVESPWTVFHDTLGIELTELPRFMGEGIGVTDLNVGFYYEPNLSWEDIYLNLDIAEVINPGELYIAMEGAEFPWHYLDIYEPGVYQVHLGAYMMWEMEESPEMLDVGSIYFSTSGSPLAFEFDAWGIRSSFNWYEVSVDEPTRKIPDRFKLFANFPNPFNSSTNISFALPDESKVTLDVFNILGEKIETVVENENFPAGYHLVKFNADNLPTGVYLYEIKTDFGTKKRKMLLLK